jgi:hypothetical protein
MLPMFMLVLATGAMFAVPLVLHVRNRAEDRREQRRMARAAIRTGGFPSLEM